MLTVRDKQMKAMAAASPGQPMVAPCQPTWVEIRLVDDQKNPVPGERYRIVLPDSSIMEGSLDQDGKARVEGIIAGQCQITFPEMDQLDWKQAG